MVQPTTYRLLRSSRQLLCPLTFLWQPQENGVRRRRLWLWLHPVAFDAAMAELQLSAERVFAGRGEEGAIPERNNEEECHARKKRKTDSSQTDDAEELQASEAMSTEQGITIRDCRGQVCRISLLGPFSTAVLSETIKLRKCEPIIELLFGKQAISHSLVYDSSPCR